MLPLPTSRGTLATRQTPLLISSCPALYLAHKGIFFDAASFISTDKKLNAPVEWKHKKLNWKSLDPTCFTSCQSLHNLSPNSPRQTELTRSTYFALGTRGREKQAEFRPGLDMVLGWASRSSLRGVRHRVGQGQEAQCLPGHSRLAGNPPSYPQILSSDKTLEDLLGTALAIHSKSLRGFEVLLCMDMRDMLQNF